jgi:hypothetical protein
MSVRNLPAGERFERERRDELRRLFGHDHRHAGALLHQLADDVGDLVARDPPQTPTMIPGP